MKNLFYFIVFALLMGGCAYKNEALRLESYKADYSGPVSDAKKSIYLSSVQDMRTDKRSVGYVYNNGDKLATLFTDVNFEDKYSEGLGYALGIAGFKKASSADDASFTMEVYIRDVRVIYNDKNFDENLKGEIEIEVIIRRGQETITQNFKQKGAKWLLKSYESKDLEPFLHTLFTDSINEIVARLTRY